MSEVLTNRSTVLVTGASGFIGRAVVSRLVADGLAVRAALRGETTGLPLGAETAHAPDLGAPFDWSASLAGCDVVLHAAARVHVMREAASDPDSEFHRANFDGTMLLARQAEAAGVKRFIFLSSIKVNGEHTRPGRPFTADDTPGPEDAYGRSKLEAERALRVLAASGRMELVIIRPVLVYGPGVKGNFRAMMRWLARGTPLPLGAIDNRRSFVSLGNLVDLVATTLRHAAAGNQTFLVSDDFDLSTTELLRRVATFLGRRPTLIPIPQRALEIGAALAGMGDSARRLLGSLQVDISKTRGMLGWTPPLTLDDGLRAATSWFLAHEHAGA